MKKKKKHLFRIATYLPEHLQQSIKSDAKFCRSEAAYIGQIIEEFYSKPVKLEVIPAPKRDGQACNQCEAYLKPSVFNAFQKSLKGQKASHVARFIITKHYEKAS